MTEREREGRPIDISIDRCVRERGDFVGEKTHDEM